MNLLVTNIVDTLTYSSLSMVGGKINQNYSSKNNFFSVILILFILLLIKGYIIYILYNNLVPKIIYSLSDKKSLDYIEDNFKELSYIESIMLVIFANTLFSS